MIVVGSIDSISDVGTAVTITEVVERAGQLATEAVPSSETEQTELNEPIACSCMLRRAEPMSERAVR